LPDTPLRTGRGDVSLGDAVARFLDRYRDEKSTRVTYAETLAGLLAAVGGTAFVTEAGPQAYAAVMSRWDDRAPATWNKHLAALRSFAAYAIRQEWITADPARHLERRKITQRGDKAIPLARLETLFTDDRHALRERLLWRLLYDTAARAGEILTLDIGDLDTEFRRARTRGKGGDIDTCTGPPPPPGSCPGCWPAAPPGRCSWPAGARQPRESAPGR
jgi:site-specific recombinase XerD